MSLSSLQGQRVLELGSYIASPYAGHLLSHLGAEVIKIEAFEGDPTRTLFQGGPAGTFIAFSHGKRSICINLASAQGHAVFERLVASANILVHNLAPEAVRKLRLSHADCHRINPALVYCQIAGYGPGPRENEKITNPLIEAATGVMAHHLVDGRPTRIGPSYFDLFAGSNAVIGILSALVSPQPTMRRVDVGLFETGLHVSAKEIMGGQLEAQASKGAGGAATTASAVHEFVLPGYAAYRTRDGRWLHLLMLADSHWAAFCRGMQQSCPPGMEKLSGRQQQREQAETLVRTSVQEKDFADVSARLTAAGCKFTEVVSFAHALDDVQAQHTGKTYAVNCEGAQYAMPDFPVHGTEPGGHPLGEVPRLGQHTLELLRSLDYTPAEREALIAGGAVLAAPD